MNAANDKLIMSLYQSYLPKVKDWIESLLLEHYAQALPIITLNFSRLPYYFSKEVLSASKVVYVDQPPQIPLSSMGLTQFQDFERMRSNGITYYDTFFVRSSLKLDESLHFHELVHVVQWKCMGPDRFLLLYGLELLKNTYNNSLFENMAYNLQSKFQKSKDCFDVESVVQSDLQDMLQLFE
jgi:hypothetical protein